ncbi:MAG: UDP-3-O-acyl-N-acetylglucosamine deacetylase, partial [Sphingobacteriaceae bacterium]|nr:UDP-3-O-acyl-N-acetylglucosamine deacetylase [Sphingobacteriaceae bacterium]
MILNTKQKTIKKEVSIAGVGLHTGANVCLTFCPASDNHGFKFQRIDLPGMPIIEADCDLVTDTARGTTLTKNGASISTVEHVMASLIGQDLDNVLMKIDGPEMPIMDGSSIKFVELLESAGIEEQQSDREYFQIPHNLTYADEKRGVEMVAMPLDD